MVGQASGSYSELTPVWSRQLITLIAWWYCCLNPREAAVLRAVASYYTLTGAQFVPYDTWLGFCASFGLTATAMRDAFYDIYRLRIDTMVVLPEEPPELVVVPDFPAEWYEFQAYVGSSASLCLDGCGQSKLPWQVD